MTTALEFRLHERAKSAADQAARIAAMPPSRRDRWSEQMRDGIADRSVTEAVSRFRDLLRDMAVQLEAQAWLGGEACSLADTGQVAFIDRLDRLGLAAAWALTPSVGAWLATMRARPSVVAALDDWLAVAPPMTTRDQAALDAILAQFAVAR